MSAAKIRFASQTLAKRILAIRFSRKKITFSRKKIKANNEKESIFHPIDGYKPFSQ
jgi:Holliday junction resolvase